MRTRPAALLVALALLALATGSAAQSVDSAPPPWTLGGNGQGPGYAYQVYSQQKEGEPFMRYRVRGTIDAPADVLLKTESDLAADPSRAPEGQKRQLISRTDTETVVYTSTNLPVMFSDRDVVTRGVKSVDPATGIRRIEFKAIDHPAIPPREGVIRIQHTGGYWEFVPDGANRSKVTFETYVDLGGSLPTWLISGMIASSTSGNFETLAKEATRK
jgi:START domain-containing protein